MTPHRRPRLKRLPHEELVEFRVLRVDGLRRLQLTDDGALLTLAEVGERCFAVAAAPDGTLFANVMDAGCQEYVASYDPLTLEERFRFGADRLEVRETRDTHSRVSTLVAKWQWHSLALCPERERGRALRAGI